MGPMKREAITLPEPPSNRGSYSQPGYYVIDQAGNPMSDRFDTQAQAFANLKGGAGVQYLDQPIGGHLNQPWPPELHTVVGHNQGGQMSYTEADLLRAMASTSDLEEQRYLMGALEEVRRDARQVMAGASQVDFDPPNHVGEMRPYHPYHSGAFGSSSATDWLAEMGASDDGMAEHMLTMGSRFFIGCHPEVKADPVEFLTQALGVARVAASSFADVEGAVGIFMEHVANLGRVDMAKLAVDQLLPWQAPPEVLPPLSTDEYSGPYSANQNEEVNDEPSQDSQGLPGLDNGQSARQVMSGLSLLSSHPHMSEFGFEPPTPEELAAASGPGNLNKNPNISGSQDATPEPNDDGALSGSMRGDAPVLASRHQAADDDDDGEGNYKYIKHRAGNKDSDGNDAPWVVVQKGTGKVLSSHPSRDVAIDSFKAMMRSKHGGSLTTGSQAQAPQQCTYEEYLARLSPGGYPVSREFYSGAMAAHSPSQNDPTVPGWGKRQGPKASVTERPAPFRGVTTRISARKPDWYEGEWSTRDPDADPGEEEPRECAAGCGNEAASGDRYCLDCGSARDRNAWAPSDEWERNEERKQMGITGARTAANEDMLNPVAFERATEDSAPALRRQPNGTYDPETAHIQSGEAAHDTTGLIPQGDLAEPFSHINEFPDTGPYEVPSTRATNAANRYAARPRGRKMSKEEMVRHFSNDHGLNLDEGEINRAADFPPVYNMIWKQHNIHHDLEMPTGHFFGPPHEHQSAGHNDWHGGAPTGLPEERALTPADNPDQMQLFSSRTRKAMHAYENSSSDIGGGWGDPEAPCLRCGKVGNHPNHMFFGAQPNPGKAADDYALAWQLPEPPPAGMERLNARVTGANPEDYGPKGRSGGAQSSETFINWDFNNQGSDLGMPPVQGYMQDADNPNGEMWPFEIGPVGAPPQGAAAVGDVPTPGIVSAEATGSSYPQPKVTKSSQLDAWRANIAARAQVVRPF